MLDHKNISKSQLLAYIPCGPQLIFTLIMLFGLSEVNAQVAIHNHYQFGSPGWSTLGYSVHGGLDINLDSVPDYIVSDPGADTLTTNDLGEIRVYSGKDGSLIGAISGNTSGVVFGANIKLISDTTGDGVPDILVGEYGANGGLGAVHVYSGSTLSLHTTYLGLSTSSGIGLIIEPIGDVDADNLEDFVLVSNPSFPAPAFGAYNMRILSSQATPTVTFGSPGIFQMYGASVGKIKDMNSDGLDDYFIATSGFFSPSTIQIISGNNGNIINTLPISIGTSSIVGGIKSARLDYDLDGFDDFIINDVSSFWIASSSSGAQIFSSSSLTNIAGLKLIEVVNDLNGNLQPEYVLTAPLLVNGIAPTVLFYDIALNAIIGTFQLAVPASFNFSTTLPRVTSIGDITQDGQEEVLIGFPASGNSTTTGTLGAISSVHVVSPLDMTSYGNGCSASNINQGPSLFAGGSNTAGGTLNLFLTNSTAGLPGILLIGNPLLTPISVTNGTCYFHLDLTQTTLTIPFVTDSAGNWNASFVIPPGLSGYNLALQAFVGFSSSPIGTDQSQGVYLRFD